jgi:hypothetical protein
VDFLGLREVFFLIEIPWGGLTLISGHLGRA